MASASDYLEERILNHIFRTTALPQSPSVFVALFTGDPTDAGTGPEVAGGAYTRVGVGRADANWTAPAVSGTNRRISNAIAITFPSPTLDWGLVTHFAIFDAITAGNMLVYGQLGVARTVAAGDNPPSFAIGALTIDLG